MVTIANSKVNEGFSGVTNLVCALKKAGLLKAQKLVGFRGLVLESQSQISHDIADRMHHVEKQDMLEYGKTRIAWEHWLNPERPEFHKSGDGQRT